MAPALMDHSATCNFLLATHCYIHHISASIATELDLHVILDPNPEINMDPDQHLTQNGMKIAARSPSLQEFIATSLLRSWVVWSLH